MKAVYEDNGFSNPSANQIYNGAKLLLGGQLDATKGAFLHTLGISAKASGTPLMSQEDFNALDQR